MESINRIRAVHRKLNEPDTVAHPISDEEHELGEHERTLAEIFADDETKKTFLNKFLFDQDSVKAREIADSLADEHVLTAAQDKWMESMRKEFNVRSFEVEHVSELLDNENIQHLADLNPQIALIVGKIGTEKAAEFLSKEFGELAFTDTSAFKRTIKAMRGLKDSRERPATLALEKEMRGKLEKYGLSLDEYAESTVAGKDYWATTKALEKKVKEQYGLFKKGLDFVSGGALSWRAGKNLYATYEKQTKLMDESDKHMKSIGKVLQSTLNQDTKLAIQKFMLEGGTIDTHKEKQTVETIQDYREAKHATDPLDVQERYEAYLAAEMKKRNIKNVASQPHIIDDCKEAFATQEAQRQSKYFKAVGLFGLLVALLFRDKNTIKNSLK